MSCLLVPWTRDLLSLNVRKVVRHEFNKLAIKHVRLCAGPRAAEILGEAAVSTSVLAYAVPDSQASRLQPTLTALRQELLKKKLPSGPGITLRLCALDDQIAVRIGVAAAQFFGLRAGRHGFLSVEDGADPRPLYFIPRDPDADQTWEAPERESGRVQSPGRGF